MFILHLYPIYAVVHVRMVCKCCLDPNIPICVVSCLLAEVVKQHFAGFQASSSHPVSPCITHPVSPTLHHSFIRLVLFIDIHLKQSPLIYCKLVMLELLVYVKDTGSVKATYSDFIGFCGQTLCSCAVEAQERCV